MVLAMIHDKFRKPSEVPPGTGSLDDSKDNQLSFSQKTIKIFSLFLPSLIPKKRRLISGIILFEIIWYTSHVFEEMKESQGVATLM